MDAELLQEGRGAGVAHLGLGPATPPQGPQRVLTQRLRARRGHPCGGRVSRGVASSKSTSTTHWSASSGTASCATLSSVAP